MAHIKKGLDYYSHTTNMTDSAELLDIRMEYGSVGVMVWFALLDLIYEHEGYFIRYDSESCNRTLIQIMNKVSGKDAPTKTDIMSVISYMVEIGLFDAAAFEKGILTSCDIQMQYFQGTLKRKDVKVDKDIWMLSMDDMLSVSEKSPIISFFNKSQNQNDVILSDNDVIISDNDVNLKQSKVKKSKVKESREKAEESKEKAEESKVNAPACELADALSSDRKQDSCESGQAEELDYTQYSSYVIDDENGEPQPYIPSGEPAVMQEDAPVYGVDIPFPEPPPEEDSCGYAPDLTQEEYDPDAYDFSLEELAQRSPVGAAVAQMLSHCNIITEDGRRIPVTEYQPDRKGKPAAPLPAPTPVQKSSDGVEHKPDHALMASLTRTAMQGGTIDISDEIAKICAEGQRNSALFEQKYGSREEYQRQMDEQVLASAEVTVIKMPKPKPPEELPPQHKELARRYGENNVQLYLVRYRQWCERNTRPIDDPYPAIERWMAKDLGRGN